MKVNFIHVCDTAFLSTSGNLNIIGIFESIFAPNLPVIHPRITIVANIEGEIGPHDFGVKIIDKQGKVINELRGNFVLDRLNRKFGIISAINSIRFEKEGVYSIELIIDSAKIGETEFEVRLVGQIS